MNKISKFLELSDAVIREAALVKVQAAAENSLWLVDFCDKTTENLSRIREKAAEGVFPKHTGAGLGLTRTVSEAGVPETLYKVGYELETFYKNEYGT